jgi:type I restriction enzyme S subunit
MMRELGATTKMATLKDLGTWRGGGTPSKSNPAFWAEGTIPWVTPKDMKVFRIGDSEDCITPEAVDQSSAPLVSGPSVAVVVRSGILQRTLPVAVVQLDATFNQDMKALQPKDGVRPEYVAYYLRGFERDILASCSKNGTTVASIDFARFHAYPIPLPSFEEQKQIVDEIETQFARLDDAVAALQRARTRLKRYRASVLKAACEGRLVPTEAELALREGRDYEPASVLLDRIKAEREANAGKKRGKTNQMSVPDALALPELPEGWVWTNLSELLAVPLSNGRSVPTAEVGFPVLRLTALVNGTIDLTKRKIGRWTEAEASRFLVTGGDFLVSRGNGSLRLVGRGGLVPDNPDRVAFPDTLIRVRAIGWAIAPKFLANMWNSGLVRERIERSARTTAGIYKVNQTDLSNVQLPLPPRDEQERIVTEVERRLSVIEQVETTVETNLKRGEALRQSILRMAFRGRLVPTGEK